MSNFTYKDLYDSADTYTLKSSTVSNLREESLNDAQTAATGTNSRLRAIIYQWGQALVNLYNYGSNPFTDGGINGLKQLSATDLQALATLNEVFPQPGLYDRLVYSDAGLAPEPDADPSFSCPPEINIPNIWELITENITWQSGENVPMDFSICVNNTATNQGRTTFGDFIGNLYSAQLTSKSNPSNENAIPNLSVRMLISTELHHLLAPFPYAVPSSSEAINYPYSGENFSTDNPPSATDNLPTLSSENPFSSESKGSLGYSLGRLWESMDVKGLLIFSVPCADYNSEELFVTGEGTTCNLRYYTRNNDTGDVTNYFKNGSVVESDEYTDPDETPALYCPPVIRRIKRSDLEGFLDTFSGGTENNEWIKLDLSNSNVINSGIIFSGDQSGSTITNANSSAASTQYYIVYAVKRGP